MITNRHMVYLTLTLIYIMMSCSCSKRQASEIVPEGNDLPTSPTAAVTYANFTQALIQSRCSGCHNSGGSAAAIWTFTGRASVVSNESRIRRVVLINRSMPLGSTLSASEIASLQQWFDNNMPE